MIAVKFAKNKIELDNIIELRYKILRQPWSQPFETSTDGLEDSAYNAFIENEGGKVVACGRLQENANHIGQIRYMAVADGEQGKGFGKMILKALEDKAKEIGLMRIELQARENALAFYERHDYKLKERSFKLWDIIQHYLMEKKLN
jgi:N-acetylglutamate synthase-like GNAT family acetyltransferase